MRNILCTIIIASFLTACSNFLSDYSQDLSKVETVADLNELLLGDAYLPSASMKLTITARHSHTIHSSIQCRTKSNKTIRRIQELLIPCSARKIYSVISPGNVR